ncbi:hypothetical protein [Priestia aryabhattai]
MNVIFNIDRILLLDRTLDSNDIQEKQAVVGTIENKNVFIVEISSDKMKQIRLQGIAERQLSSYESVKKAYKEQKEQMKVMYQIERQLLKQLQSLCPHTNTYRVEDDEFLSLDDIPYTKCKDCGNVLE